MVNKWMLYLEQSPIILISYEQLDSKIVEGGKLISIRIDPEKVDSLLGYMRLPKNAFTSTMKHILYRYSPS